MEVIKASGLKKAFPDVWGLAGLDLKIQAGEMVGILGPSGSGKTTFFRLLNGSLMPSTGELEVLGQPMGQLSHKELRELRSKIAVVYQNHNVVPNLSVAHNVLLGGLGRFSLLHNLAQLIRPVKKELATVMEILQQLGIVDKMYTRCSDLSGGQQQRVAMARVLYARPEIILADEPIASVDAKTAEMMLNLFKEQNKAGKTVILNLHQIDFALHYCTRLLVLNRGRLVYDGKPGDFTDSAIYRDKFATEVGGDGLAG